MKFYISGSEKGCVVKVLKKSFEKFDIEWRKNLEGGIDSFSKRRSATLHSFWIDHEFLRKIYHNDFEVDKGVFRSNQPSPKRIEKWYKKGIKTIINFRGETNQGAYFLEEEACRKFSIDLINFPLYATKLPSKKTILELETIFKEVKKPFLMHCKSGADRAGIMCALYLLSYKKEHPEIAKTQLSWKYLHVKWAKPGILDSFVEEYSKQYKQNKMKFLDWVKKKYNPEKLESDFQSVWWVNRLLDDFLKRE